MLRIAVAGTGYVGLSVALLLSQHNTVKALDILPEKVALLNKHQSPIRDREIEEFLAGDANGSHPLDFTATLNVSEAYTDAEYVVIATPTNYDSERLDLQCDLPTGEAYIF